MKEKWDNFRYWMYRNISPLDDVGLKHRSYLMVLALLTLFIPLSSELVLGNASFAGLGITITPPITLPIGFVLLLLLTYRLVAFWASVAISSGTDNEIAKRKSMYKYDPGYQEGGPLDSMEALVAEETYSIKFVWRARQMIWEIILPNLIVAGAAVRYIYLFFSKSV